MSGERNALFEALCKWGGVNTDEAIEKIKAILRASAMLETKFEIAHDYSDPMDR